MNERQPVRRADNLEPSGSHSQRKGTALDVKTEGLHKNPCHWPAGRSSPNMQSPCEGISACCSH